MNVLEFISNNDYIENNVKLIRTRGLKKYNPGTRKLKRE